MSTSLKFNLKLKERPVTLVKDDKEHEYVLREMTGAGRDKYLDQTGARMRYDAEGKAVGFKSYEGMQADLLVHCLFRGDGTNVGREELQKFPASVLGALFAEAQKLNGLEARVEAEAEAGNESDEASD